MPYRLSGNRDNTFSVAALVWDSSTVSHRCLFQWNDRTDKSLQRSGVEHLRNFTQLFLARFDDKECILHALVLGPFAVRGDGYHASARLQHGPGSIEGLAAHCVEYNVNLLDLVLE